MESLTHASIKSPFQYLAAIWYKRKARSHRARRNFNAGRRPHRKFTAALYIAIAAILSSFSPADTAKNQALLIDWSETPDLSYAPIKVTLNGDTHLTFMIDTAAYNSSISIDAAKELGLLSTDPDTIGVENVSGYADLDLTNEVEIQLEAAPIKHRFKLPVDRLRSGPFPEAISGIIGRDLLAGTVIENNPKRGLSLIFINHDFACNPHDTSPACEKLADYQPLVSGTWRGQKADFWIDTGAIDLDDTVMLVSEDSSKLWYENQHLLPFRLSDEISRLELRYMIEDDVYFKGKKACSFSTYIKNPEDGSFQTDELSFLLGFEYLKHLPFEVDLTTYSSDIITDKCTNFRRNTIGIEAFEKDPKTDEKLNVTYVDLGSPAWNAGIRRGDVIVGVTTADNNFITDFGKAFTDSYAQHFFAAEGSEIIVYILKGGCVLLKNITSKAYRRLR